MIEQDDTEKYDRHMSPSDIAKTLILLVLGIWTFALAMAWSTA